jgi:hypothetical protein
MEGNGSGLIWCTIGHLPGGTEKNYKNLSGQPVSWPRSEAGTSEYGAAVLTTRPQQCIAYLFPLKFLRQLSTRS